MEKASTTHRPTQTVDRALSLLRVLADSTRPLNLKDISERSSLNATTCLRLLRTLERNHYVVRLPESGLYRLGPEILTLAYALESQLDIRAVARPVLQQLSAEIGESAGLVIRQGNEGIVIERSIGPNALRHVAAVGHRGPLYCTSAGKILLAWGDPEWVERYLEEETFTPLTTSTITSAEEMRADLERVRQQGFSVDRGEREEGLIGIAVPIRDAANHVVAAIGASGPSERLPEKRIDAYIKKILDGALEISIELGWKPDIDSGGMATLVSLPEQDSRVRRAGGFE